MLLVYMSKLSCLPETHSFCLGCVVQTSMRACRRLHGSSARLTPLGRRAHKQLLRRSTCTSNMSSVDFEHRHCNKSHTSPYDVASRIGRRVEAQVLKSSEHSKAKGLFAQRHAHLGLAQEVVILRLLVSSTFDETLSQQHSKSTHRVPGSFLLKGTTCDLIRVSGHDIHGFANFRIAPTSLPEADTSTSLFSSRRNSRFVEIQIPMFHLPSIHNSIS